MPPWLLDFLFHLREQVGRRHNMDLRWMVDNPYEQLEIRIDSFASRGQPIFLRFHMNNVQSREDWRFLDHDVERAIRNYNESNWQRERERRDWHMGAGPREPATTATNHDNNLTATEVMRRQEEFIRERMMRPMGLDQHEIERWLEDLKPPVKRDPAHVKAEELLTRNLSPEQKKDWEKSSFFMVTGGTTGIQYKLTTSRTYGIETFLYGRKIGKLCVVAKDSKIPICDQLLAQKLMIETDEEKFIKLANVST